MIVNMTQNLKNRIEKSQESIDTFNKDLEEIMEKEMATHFAILAQRIPGTEEPGGLPSMGSHRVGQD